MGRPLIDVTGRRFGRLLVIRQSSTTRRREALWECRCDCGQTTTATGAHLRRGETTSCGCWQKEATATRVRTHGMAGVRRTRTYRSWQAMKERCTNPSNTSYERYGAVGVTVCARWFSSFENFLDDMGECPAGLSIDRIENSKGYEPGNCSWGTADQQSQNRSMVKLSEEAVRAIRASSEASGLLASFYGVNRSVINKVRRGVSWKNVQPRGYVELDKDGQGEFINVIRRPGEET